MAAYAAASCGHSVVLLEQNEKLGKKLFITGKGRCNVTNACEREKLFENVVSNPKFLYSAFSEFDNGDLMELLRRAGCPLKVERGERVFPVSDHASDVTAALTRLLKERGDLCGRWPGDGCPACQRAVYQGGCRSACHRRVVLSDDRLQRGRPPDSRGTGTYIKDLHAGADADGDGGAVVHFPAGAFPEKCDPDHALRRETDLERVRRDAFYPFRDQRAAGIVRQQLLR